MIERLMDWMIKWLTQCLCKKTTAGNTRMMIVFLNQPPTDTSINLVCVWERFISSNQSGSSMKTSPPFADRNAVTHNGCKAKHHKCNSRKASTVCVEQKRRAAKHGWWLCFQSTSNTDTSTNLVCVCVCVCVCVRDNSFTNQSGTSLNTISPLPIATPWHTMDARPTHTINATHMTHRLHMCDMFFNQCGTPPRM